MSKARHHRTPEQDAANKARFDHLRRLGVVGRGRAFALGSPLSGKNRAQRQRLAAGFNACATGRPNGRW